MDIASIFSAYQTSGIESFAEQRSRESGKAETGSGNNRNTGPDTIVLSSEALDKYFAMKNSTVEVDTGEADSQPSSFMDVYGQPRQEKNKKLDSAELLAFLKSDNFAEEAMGYAKAAYSSNQVGDEDESDAAADQLIKDLSEKQGAESAEKNIEDLSESGANGAFGKDTSASEKDLNSRIREVEEEIQELTTVYEQIMSSEGELDEKVRMSQPVYKRIQEKFEELQGLKAEAEGLADEVAKQA